MRDQGLTGGVLVVLPDRADAELLADGLAEEGWRPATVHRELLAGEDDAEDADWVVELLSTPAGEPATALRNRLDELALPLHGFTSDLD
ncbi:hypothetical protein [Actinoalloteichus caeruleus]|uniref:hypothetical protein n=1 Tax=Actinoalloteichus cyanogriseus TaxID=2893586 RepID=UPI00042653CB|nr:hypothetical protein [Actinoalloteichus caeruleus]